MYNQFKAIDQRPLNMGKVILNPMQLPKAGRRKKKKLHSKNPYKIKKIRILGEQNMSEKYVDGLALLKMLHFQHPRQIITANISYRRIMDINGDHLQYFTNLIELNCSQNYIPLQQLGKLPSVQIINISHNQIHQIKIQPKTFPSLHTLNLSYNYINYQCIPQLTLIPYLSKLNLSSNQLTQLPQSMHNFNSLKQIILQDNHFKSDFKAATFWAALASIPYIEIVSIARNSLRGIHTEKLVAGNFSTLIQLNFSYNVVDNQHNLICARNFISLKKLYITGNPFAVNHQHKGLQMEIYARTGAQVIIEQTNPYYLKATKQLRPPIKFQKIVKVQSDSFKKRKNQFFGLQLPKDEDLFSEDSQDEEPMFMTEQVANTKKKESKDIPVNQENGAILQQKEEQEQNAVAGSQMGSSDDSKRSKSIEYGQFHRVAAQLLGEEIEYKNSFDVHTSYKALKKALERVETN